MANKSHHLCNSDALKTYNIVHKDPRGNYKTCTIYCNSKTTNTIYKSKKKKNFVMSIIVIFCWDCVRQKLTQLWSNLWNHKAGLENLVIYLSSYFTMWGSMREIWCNKLTITNEKLTLNNIICFTYIIFNSIIIQDRCFHPFSL